MLVQHWWQHRYMSTTVHPKDKDTNKRNKRLNILIDELHKELRAVQKDAISLRMSAQKVVDKQNMKHVLEKLLDNGS